MQAHFNEQGRLISDAFGDAYHGGGPGDWLDETTHVFLRGNGLAERWANHVGTFVIGETGFGTGVNFLAAWELFERTASAGARLCFVSTEQFVLDSDILERAHAGVPQLHEPAAALRQQWPPREQEFTRLTFAGGRIVLCLLRGDARESLPEFWFRANAWFLDGFSPQQNPELWSPELLRLVGERSASDATVATFTAAGHVRRSLAAAGFDVERVPGFGKKRDMTVGTMKTPPADPRLPALRCEPPGHVDRVVVRGAGIAGASAARALIDRDIDVTVVDPNGIATGASGLGGATVRPRTWRGVAPDAQFVATAFRWTSNALDRWSAEGFDGWHACGLFECAKDAENADLLRERADNPSTRDIARFADSAEASALAGLELPFGAIYVATGGAVELATLCRWLLRDAEILQDDTITAAASDAITIDATAAALSDLPVRLFHGQALHVATEREVGKVFTGDGYVAPVRPDSTWIGSTFDRAEDREVRVDPTEDDRVRTRFTALAELREILGGEVLDRFAGVRAASPDRMPYVGPLPRADVPLTSPFAWDRLVTASHGARGATTAPFCGEILAAWLTREPIPLRMDLARRLAPVRAARRS